MDFEVIRANIADVPADAVVLPANERLKEGSGVSRAIFQAAGRKELTSACRQIGYCQVGNAVPTPAYHLQASYIVHAVVPKWRGGKQNEYDLLCSSYLSALHIADIMACRQIAFPLLAAGNNGFSIELAWRIAVKSLKSFEGNNLKEAFLIVYGDKAEAIAEKSGYRVIKGSDIKRVECRNTSNDLKIMAQDFLDKQIKNGLDWIQKPENQRKMLNIGMEIVASLMKNNGLSNKRRQ